MSNDCEHEQLDQARLIRETDRLWRHYVYRRISEEFLTEPCPAFTPQQLQTLICVRDLGPVSLKQLADAVGVKPPAASLMVDRLVEMNAVSREQNPEDRREVVIQLRPETRERLEEVEKILLQFLMEILDEMGPEHARMWCAVSKRLHQVLTAKGP